MEELFEQEFGVGSPKIEVIKEEQEAVVQPPPPRRISRLQSACGGGYNILRKNCIRNPNRILYAELQKSMKELKEYSRCNEIRNSHSHF